MATIPVKDVCEKHWDQWKGDCSGFLKAVASDLGITLTGQANAIIDAMGRDPWEQLGTDADQAVNHAGMTYLVVAGLKATPNGHVVVIVPGPAKPLRDLPGNMAPCLPRRRSISVLSTCATSPICTFAR